MVIYEIPEGATVNWTEEVDENGKNQSTITIGESTTNLQETVNQYVWIPVEDINSMVMCKSNTGDSICNLVLEENTLKCTTHPDTATDFVGRLYIGVETEKMEGDNRILSYKMDFSQRNQIYNEEDGIGEPAIVTGNGMQFDGVSSNLEVAGLVAGSKADVFFAQLKDDFKEMVTSVAKNKGFYISRYEVGANGNSKKGQMVLTMADTDGTNYLGANMWYGLYRTLRDLDAHKQMIWGCQYDQVVKFIGEEAQVGHSDRNLTATHALSGQNLMDKIKNIYDLEGNLREQTIEAETNTSRVFRGGLYSGVSNGNFNPVSHRIKRKSY